MQKPDLSLFVRTQEVYQALGITKEVWLSETPFSEGQYYRWHNPDHASSPTSRQLRSMCECLDMSINYLWFGFGPMRLSEAIEQQEEYDLAISRFMEFWGSGGGEVIAEIHEIVKRLDRPT